MRQRLEYIDAIKGFAIFLVVMGHVIPWCFKIFDEVPKMSPTPILLWKIIYSFHMPLFMFISGFLYGQSHFTSAKEYFDKMWKKMKMLIIPWVVSGILVQMWRGGRDLTYWYLLTLFQLLILVGVENFFFDRIKNKTCKIVVEAITLGITGLFLNFVTKIYDSPVLYVFYDWFPHLRGMFGYFALGSFIMRNLDVTKLMNSKIYSLCLLFFCISCAVEIPYISFMSISLKSVAAIYCSLYMFKVCFTEGYAIGYLKRIGKSTMQIYILHLFFSFKISFWGDYFIALSQAGRMEFVTAFVFQLLYTLVVSFIIIELCLYTGKFIKTSPMFAFLLLGESVSAKRK